MRAPIAPEAGRSRGAGPSAPRARAATPLVRVLRLVQRPAAATSWSWADAVTTGTGALGADITADSRDGWQLHPGEPYRVRIRAVNTQGPGLPSAAAEVSTPPTAPGEPYDVQGEPGDRAP